MLRIRGLQIGMLQETTTHEFEERILIQVTESFPKHRGLLGEAPLRATVRLGFSRARAHGFRSERSLRAYVDLMFMLGSGFDVDPQLPWSAAALDDPTSPDEATRVDRLWRAAGGYLERVAGRGNEHLLGALHRARGLSLPASNTSLSVGELVPPLLKGLMPTKAEHLGPDGIARLILAGGEAAKYYGMAGTRATTLYLALMFLLGGSFDQDPLAPWASTILTDTTIPDSHARVARLHAAAMSNLNAWLQ